MGNLSILGFEQSGALVVWPGSHKYQVFLENCEKNGCKDIDAMKTQAQNILRIAKPIQPQLIEVDELHHLLFVSSMLHAGASNSSHGWHMRNFNYLDSLLYSPQSPVNHTYSHEDYLSMLYLPYIDN